MPPNHLARAAWPASRAPAGTTLPRNPAQIVRLKAGRGSGPLNRTDQDQDQAKDNIRPVDYVCRSPTHLHVASPAKNTRQLESVIAGQPSQLILVILPVQAGSAPGHNGDRAVAQKQRSTDAALASECSSMSTSDIY